MFASQPTNTVFPSWGCRRLGGVQADSLIVEAAHKKGPVVTHVATDPSLLVVGPTTRADPQN